MDHVAKEARKLGTSVGRCNVLDPKLCFLFVATGQTMCLKVATEKANLLGNRSGSANVRSIGRTRRAGVHLPSGCEHGGTASVGFTLACYEWNRLDVDSMDLF